MLMLITLYINVNLLSGGFVRPCDAGLCGVEDDMRPGSRLFVKIFLDPCLTLALLEAYPPADDFGLRETADFEFLS